jgi:hypothetical protein
MRINIATYDRGNLHDSGRTDAGDGPKTKDVKRSALKRGSTYEGSDPCWRIRDSLI